MVLVLIHLVKYLSYTLDNEGGFNDDVYPWLGLILCGLTPTVG